jgi:predicted PurR-regulated permease PerM
MKMQISLPFYLKLLSVLAIIFLLTFIALLGKLVLVPLIVSTLMAILFLPVSRFLEGTLKMPRSIASIFSVVLLIVIVTGIAIIMGSQFTKLSQDWPAFKQQFETEFNDLQNWISATFGIQKSDQLNYINDSAAKSVTAGAGILTGAIASISSMLVFCVFTVIYMFFMLLYRTHIRKFLILNFTELHHPTVLSVLDQIQYVVKKYLIGLVIQMSMVSAMATMTYGIIGVKYFIMLGLLTGILNILPYVGILAAFLFTSIITFATGTLYQVLLVGIGVVVVHVIDANYIMPKIVGSKVKINSFLAMLGIVVGEMIWGISGMFLSIPIIAICKIVFDHVQGLKPWGFLLGEEDSEVPLFSKTFSRFRKGVKTPAVVVNPEEVAE